MKRVSMVALAAALSLGVAMPATAQKAKSKPKEAADAPLQVGPEYRKVAAAAENALKAQDFAAAATKVGEAETLAKNDDEKYYAADLRLRLGIAQHNKVDQLKAIDVLILSPRTPPERARVLGAYQQFSLGSTAMEKKDFAGAIPYLLKARELGSTEIDLPILLANAYSATNKMADSVAEVDRAIAQTKAKGEKPPESWYRFAIPRVNTLGNRAVTAGWMNRLLADYPTVGNWRWGIVVYRDGVNRAGTPLDAKAKIDLFRLMRGTGVLADQQDYFDYAKAAVELGLPLEALAVIDEGKKSDKIPADAPAFVQVLATAKKAADSESPLDQLIKEATAAKEGSGAAALGDVFFGSGNHARAIEFYDLALQKGGIGTDPVHLHRGVALVLAGRKAEAGAAFAEVKGQPLADIAQFWTTWINLPGPLAP